MADLRNLIERASAYGLLLSSDGPRLRVESVTRQPVPASFRAELLAQKSELLAYLGWRGEATEIVCAAMRRLEDHYPIGCPMDEPDWRAADALIADAFWSGDLDVLHRVVAEYERFALRHFELYRADRERHHEPG